MKNYSGGGRINCVGLFFYIDGKFLFHSCPLEDAELYGDFLNYPLSHDAVWQIHYAGKFGVDFDYYPRGRVVYRKPDATFIIYYDKCIGQHITEIVDLYKAFSVKIGKDEHYQCYCCNENYVV